MKTYEKYKPSGVHWIGNIPAHWNIKKVKYSTSCNKSALSEKTDDEFELEYIDIGSVDSSGRVLSVENHRFIDAPSRARRIVNSGDTIISTVRTYLKAIAFIEPQKPNLICSTGFAVITPDRDLFDSKFLYFVCRSEPFVDEICAVSKGVSYPAVDSGDIRNFYLWIPPIAEQTAIADYLDKETARIDEVVGKKKRLIELLKEESLAIINHAVTRGLDPTAKLKPSNIEWLGDIPEHWDVKPLRYLVEKVGSGVTPSGGAEVYLTEGIPLLRSQNIYSNRLEMDDVAYISEEIDESMSNSRTKEMDVLLNITGASIGRCFYVPKGFGRANVNQHVCIVRPIQSKVTTEFLHLFLVSGIGITSIDFCQGGANRQGLNFEQIKGFHVPVPPVSEQKQIVRETKVKTQKIDATVEKVEKEIGLLNEYRTALISEVVTGKVKVM